MPKARQVNRMFSSIAERYDLANTLLSFNRDSHWREFAVEKARVKEGERALDVATGTGKIARRLREEVGKKGEVVGSDFNLRMLGMAARRKGISFLLQDGMRMALKDESFHSAIVGFGIRNMESPEKAIEEMARVVERGGRVVVLEFSMPYNRVVRGLYSFYFFRILPLLGGLITGNREAYSYLPQSVAEFPRPEELREIMEGKGLETHYYPLTLGTVVVHVGVKR